MEELKPEQLLESLRSWKPTDELKARLMEKMRLFEPSAALAPDLAGAFYNCSQTTYDYIQFVNELAASKVLDRKGFLPLVARLGKLVQDLQESSEKYGEVFRRYDASARPSLQKGRFDTVYYDTIQGVDIRELLKKVIDEVEIVLQSFSLISAELARIRCVDLYEGSIRFQLFLQYFLMKERFSVEEFWSVLFDVYNQALEMREETEGLAKEELEKLQEQIQKYKAN